MGGAELFRFTISDVGTFLGKSPVTIRAWERKGLIKLPRVGTNRALTLPQVLDVAKRAHDLGRITRERLALIREAVIVLKDIEEEH